VPLGSVLGDMVLHPHPKLSFISAMLLNTFQIPLQVAAFAGVYAICYKRFDYISNGASSDAIFYISFL